MPARGNQPGFRSLPRNGRLRRFQFSKLRFAENYGHICEKTVFFVDISREFQKDLTDVNTPPSLKPSHPE
jgi:hypothetical protein